MGATGCRDVHAIARTPTSCAVSARPAFGAPIFSRDVGVQRESSAKKIRTRFDGNITSHFTGRYSRGRPMEGATKICMRCKQELENNQTNYPHGSSWCIECAPPDSDSD